MPSDNLKSYLHLHLIVFIWGFTAILGALISLEALPLVWFRMLFAVGFIGIYIYYKKISLKVPIKIRMQLLFSGLIIALHWFTFFHAIKISNISITLACLSTGALFASLLEPILYGKKIVFYEVFFGLLVVLGLYIIFNVEGNYFWGMIMLFGERFSAEFFQLSIKDLLFLLLLSSVCTAYAFIASTSIMKFLSPYTVMLTINLEPIYGIILAVLIFQEKEKMSFEFYIGAFIILLTVLLNALLKSRKLK